MIPVGRHFLGEQKRRGLSGESVGGRPRRRVARWDGLAARGADLTGLSSQVTAALADTYRGPWTHAPGDVFAGLAAAVADGADCVDGVGQLWIVGNKSGHGRTTRPPPP